MSQPDITLYFAPASRAFTPRWIALFNGRIAEPATSLISYNERLSERSAYKRAAEATWPPLNKEAG